MKIQAFCLFISLSPVALPGLAVAASDAPSPPSPAAPPVAVQPTIVTGAERDRDIKKADDFLTSATTMVADFVQTNSADQKQSEGKVSIQKPGKLRFEYSNPATLDVIADGSEVAVDDRRLKTQTKYWISQTPLKFLLQSKIDLAADTQILRVEKTPQEVMILLDDRTTFGGTSRVRLFFDANTFRLNRWQVVDPQGYETLVELYNMDLTQKPDPKLFKIGAMDQAKK